MVRNSVNFHAVGNRGNPRKVGILQLESFMFKNYQSATSLRLNDWDICLLFFDREQDKDHVISMELWSYDRALLVLRGD